MFTSVTYTPAALETATSVVGNSFGSTTYTGGNEPIVTLENYFILNQDGSYILNQDGSKIIWGQALVSLIEGDDATGTTYLVGNDV